MLDENFDLPTLIALYVYGTPYIMHCLHPFLSRLYPFEVASISLICLYVQIQFRFRIMEEVSVNRVQKYSKVEQKLEQLAQAKLQGINTNTLRKVEDRLLALEKGLCEQTATSEKTVREYRLMLRKYEEQWEEVSNRCHQSSLTRACKLTELKELMADYFSREDTDSKTIFKQVPLAFEEKTQRLGRQLADQITERRQQTTDLESRVEEALLGFRAGMHSQLQALDQEAEARFEDLRGRCQALRGDICKQAETRRAAEGSLMVQVRETVNEVKQALANQREEREKNRDKLWNLLSNAKEMIARSE